MVGARRSTQEGRRGAPSDRPRYAFVALARQSEFHRAACLAVTRAAPGTQPDIYVFDLDPAEDDLPVLRARRARRARSSWLNWVSRAGSKRPARGFTSSFRSIAMRASRTSRTSRTPLGAVLVARDPAHLTQEFAKGRPRWPHLRGHGTQRLQRHVCRRIPCVPSPVRRCRAVHLGRSGTRRRAPADVHVAY